MTHYLKFAVLQGILLAVIAALVISGVLDPVFKSDAKWVILGLIFVLIYGLTSVARKVWASSAWAAMILVRLGIIGLQTSMAMGLLAVVAGGNNKAFLLLLVNGMYASVFALIASVLLDANVHFLGASDEPSQE